MLMNVLGYYMHYYPAPVMVMEPTLDMAQALSKDFLAPMIRDMPVLSALVDTKSRYSGNTILKKNFPGGHVTIVGPAAEVGGQRIQVEAPRLGVRILRHEMAVLALALPLVFPEYLPAIRYQKIIGDTMENPVWENLDAFLLTPFHKKDGTALYISTA